MNECRYNTNFVLCHNYFYISILYFFCSFFHVLFFHSFMLSCSFCILSVLQFSLISYFPFPSFFSSFSFSLSFFLSLSFFFISKKEGHVLLFFHTPPPPLWAAWIDIAVLGHYNMFNSMLLPCFVLTPHQHSQCSGWDSDTCLNATDIKKRHKVCSKWSPFVLSYNTMRPKLHSFKYAPFIFFFFCSLVMLSCVEAYLHAVCLPSFFIFRYLCRPVWSISPLFFSLSLPPSWSNDSWSYIELLVGDQSSWSERSADCLSRGPLERTVWKCFVNLSCFKGQRIRKKTESFWKVLLCVCVCERERERERPCQPRCDSAALC